MQEDHNKPSFGIFLIRVLFIALALFLFGFIVWGIFQLANSSDAWMNVVRVILVFVVLGLIALGIRFFLGFIRSNAISLNFGRILGLIAGIVLISLLVWGVFRLADTSNDAEVVKVDDEANSTITLDAPDSESAAGNDGSPPAADDEPTERSPAPSTPPPTPTPSTTGSTTPTTGPSAETLPNTGIESAILPALSLGILAYAAKSYRTSRKQLGRI